MTLLRNNCPYGAVYFSRGGSPFPIEDLYGGADSDYVWWNPIALAPVRDFLGQVVEGTYKYYLQGVRYIYFHVPANCSLQANVWVLHPDGSRTTIPVELPITGPLSLRSGDKLWVEVRYSR